MNREQQIRVATLLRHVVQGFDSGGESARSFRARFAEAAFDLLHQDDEDFFAEYKKMESDPYAYFLSVTELRSMWQDKTPT